MRLSLLEILRCPHCAGPLSVDGEQADGRVAEGTLACPSTCGRSWPIRAGIPRFVGSGYADNFGLQWNIFRATQLDSHTGASISRERFLSYTGWTTEDIAGQRVFDAGCGAGRFCEVASNMGARVVAIDYSAAIDAAKANLGDKFDVDFVQADINVLPFAPGTFPFVYCLGVIQHTPDPSATFQSLARVTKRGGRLAVDVYPKLWKNLFFAKYWIRPFTRRLEASRSLAIVRRIFPALYPLSRAVGRIPVVGHYLKYLIPVVNYEGVYPLDPYQQREWALLDTFDMWAPAYDQPQTLETVREWFDDAQFEKVETFHSGFFVGRGQKKAAA